MFTLRFEARQPPLAGYGIWEKNAKTWEKKMDKLSVNVHHS
jgi:hypothetical protein